MRKGKLILTCPKCKFNPDETFEDTPAEDYIKCPKCGRAYNIEFKEDE
jgi:uncharacterized protein YbaR (Trm112 family)